MQALYEEGGAWLAESLLLTGHPDEARQIGEESLAMSDRVLALRPGYRLALHSQQVIESDLIDVATNSLDPAESLKMGLRAEATSENMLRLDPGNVVTLNNLGVTHQGIAGALWSAGRVRESIPYYRKSIIDTAQAIPGGSGFAMVACYFASQTAFQQAQTGDFAGAENTLATAVPIWQKLYKTEGTDSMEPALAEATDHIGRGALALERGDAATGRRLASQEAERVQALEPKSGVQGFQKYATLWWAHSVAGQAAYSTR